MNKDIEWLKKEIATEMIELEPNRKERWSDVRYQTLRNVAQKIDQLDELKVLSQEWIDNNAVHVRGLGDIFEAVAVESLLVPKRELPVIPKFVAEAFEKAKGSNVYAEQLITEMYDSSDEVGYWLEVPSNEKLLLRAWLDDSYETEKEKLYYVLNKQGETLLVFIGGVVCLSSGYALRDNNKDKYQLTEKQIKDYDERYLPFMVPINEANND